MEAPVSRPPRDEAEIETGMSVDDAMQTVLALNGTQHAPELAALIRKKLGGAALRGRRATTTEPPLDMKGTGGKAPKGYAALAPATEMLNGMMKEAAATPRCSSRGPGRASLRHAGRPRFARNRAILPALIRPG